jgi:hypothetical protein
MRCKAVLVALALSFTVPVLTATAEAAEAGTVRASSADTSCRGKRAKKQDGENKSNDGKSKKKDKDGKKSYGFEL